MTALLIIGIILSSLSLLGSLALAMANWQWSDEEFWIGVGGSVTSSFTIVVMAIALGNL